MKLLLTTAAAIALISLGGCNRGPATNNATANNSTASAPANNAAPADTGGKPAGDANAAAPADGAAAAPGDAGGKPTGDATTSSGDAAPPAEGTGGK
jgi:hypothetical protein